MRGHGFMNSIPDVASPPRHITLSAITSFPALESYVRFAGEATKRAQDNVSLHLAGSQATCLVTARIPSTSLIPVVFATGTSVYVYLVLHTTRILVGVNTMHATYVPGRNCLLLIVLYCIIPGIYQVRTNFGIVVGLYEWCSSICIPGICVRTTAVPQLLGTATQRSHYIVYNSRREGERGWGSSPHLPVVVAVVDGGLKQSNPSISAHGHE